MLIMQNAEYCHRRRAFSVIELLVTIGIVGVLAALVLPVVQYARESARRASCRSNLRQIGIALENQASTTGHFPDAEIVFRELLPSLDQAEVFRNIGNGIYDDGIVERPDVSTFRCASDRLRPVSDTLNYAANVGTGYLVDGMNGFFTTENPTFVPVNANQSKSVYLSRHRDITDGLSQTIAIAEMLPSSREGMFPPSAPITDVRRVDWLVDPALTQPAEFEQLVERCSAIRDNPATGVRTGTTRGWGWSSSVRNFGQATYHHVLAPDMPSCLNASFQYALFSAGSTHAGGVNALYGDGHVEFVSDLIDHKVWRDLGTRAGTLRE